MRFLEKERESLAAHRRGGPPMAGWPSGKNDFVLRRLLQAAAAQWALLPLSHQMRAAFPLPWRALLSSQTALLARFWGSVTRR